MKKKYNFLFEADICLTDVKKVINWADQGWRISECCPTHSLMATIYKDVEIEMDSIDVERYIVAINSLNGNIHVAVCEEVKEEQSKTVILKKSPPSSFS